VWRHDHAGAASQKMSIAPLSSEASRVRSSRQGFDGGLGFLDVFEEGDFAVVAAPAAGFEQLGEVIQPLLGQDAPAREPRRARVSVQSVVPSKSPLGEKRTQTQRTESVSM